MKITFSKNNNKEIAVLPYVGEDCFSLEFGENNNETFNTVGKGTINVMGCYGLSKISIDSTLPASSQTWTEAEMFSDPMEYVDFFDKAKQNRKPIRIVATRNDDSTIVNMLTAVESCSIKPPQRNGDIPFSITLVEYRKL